MSEKPDGLSRKAIEDLLAILLDQAASDAACPDRWERGHGAGISLAVKAFQAALSFSPEDA